MKISALENGYARYETYDAAKYRRQGSPLAMQKGKKRELPHRESNPGHARERRGS